MRIALIVATLLGCATLARPASACEEIGCIPEVLPKDGATDVPTNLRLWTFTKMSAPEAEGTVRLFESTTGTEIPVTLTTPLPPLAVLQWAPAEELTPETAYEVVFDGCSGERTQHFTTGAGPYVEAPQFSGPIAAKSYAVEGNPSCGSGEDGIVYDVEVPRAERALFYTVYRRGARVTALPEQTNADGSSIDYTSDWWSVYTAPEADAASEECFRVQAVDIAGNETANESEVCASPADGAGCSAAPAKPGAPFQHAGLCFALAALLAARRRSRRAPNR